MRMELKDLNYSYGGQLVLKKLTCTIEEGLVTGLIGPNGSGKTTLIKLLSGEFSPTSGQALLMGRPITDISPKKRAQSIAVVPQSSNLTFDFTVLDLVLMGRQPYLKRFERESSEDAQRAREAMRMLGIDQLEFRNARTLSGGEWQRVLIARALCQDTPTMLLDEPVSSLDIRHQMEVLSAIRARSREKQATVAVVLHDLNLAAHYCDRLVMMSSGKLVATGTPTEVLTRDRLMDVYGIEAEIHTDSTGTVTVAPVYV